MAEDKKEEDKKVWKQKFNDLKNNLWNSFLISFEGQNLKSKLEELEEFKKEFNFLNFLDLTEERLKLMHQIANLQIKEDELNFEINKKQEELLLKENKLNEIKPFYNLKNNISNCVNFLNSFSIDDKNSIFKKNIGVKILLKISKKRRELLEQFESELISNLIKRNEFKDVEKFVDKLKEINFDKYLNEYLELVSEVKKLENDIKNLKNDLEINAKKINQKLILNSKMDKKVEVRNKLNAIEHVQKIIKKEKDELEKELND